MLALPRPIGTLTFLAAWLVPWRPAYRIRAAQSGLTFHVHHRDAIGRHIAKYGTHEPLLTRWLSGYLAAARPGIVVDVGANVGWHALHAARASNVATVVAFEPDPFNAWLLDRNLAANGIDNVIVEVAAVGAALGVATLYRYKSSNFGRHTLVVDHGHGSRQVPVTDLDGALDRLGHGSRPITAIKIDVEGYEPAVIAGATRALGRAGAVLLEYSPDLARSAGLSPGDMLTRFVALDFTPFVLVAEGGVTRVSVEELRALEGTIDVIWVRCAGASPELLRAIGEQPRAGRTLLQIVDGTMRVKTPV